MAQNSEKEKRKNKSPYQFLEVTNSPETSLTIYFLTAPGMNNAGNTSLIWQNAVSYEASILPFTAKDYGTNQTAAASFHVLHKDC